MLQGSTDIKLVASETKLVMRHRLGKTIKAARVKNIQTIQQELFAAKEKLAKRLHDSSIDAREFSQKMNAAVNKSLKDCVKSLGRNDYIRLFELEPGATTNLVDPSIAAKAFK